MTQDKMDLAQLRQHFEDATKERDELMDAIRAVEDRRYAAISHKKLGDLPIETLLNSRNELPDPEVTGRVLDELRRRLATANRACAEARVTLGAAEVEEHVIEYTANLAALLETLVQVQESVAALSQDFRRLHQLHMEKGVALDANLYSPAKLDGALEEAMLAREVLAGRRYSLMSEEPFVIRRQWQDPKTGELTIVTEDEYKALASKAKNGTPPHYGPPLPDGAVPMDPGTFKTWQRQGK